MGTEFSKTLSFEVTHVALVAFASLTCLPLFIASLTVIRQRKDPARRQFLWLKMAFFFYFVAFLLEAISAGIVTAWSAGLSVSVIDGSTSRMADWGLFCFQIAEIFTLFMLMDLGLSILYCWGFMRGSRFTVQMATYSFGFLEFVLSVATLGIFENWLSTYVTRYVSSGTQLATANRLMVAFDVLMFVASLVVAGFAIFVQRLSSKRPEHRAASALFISAAIIWLIPNIWAVASDALWIIQGHPRSQTWPAIVNSVLSVWLSVITLILVFSIGARRARGLWSTTQPFDPAQQWGYSGQQQWIGLGAPPGAMPVYAGQQQMPQFNYPQQLHGDSRASELQDGGQGLSKRQHDNELNGSDGVWPSELHGESFIPEMGSGTSHHVTAAHK